mmetsp:Transcript_68739/g.174635  ORF Transcript_68739/g.174635 Transcript_68739/m.174635 type:complete len:257 (+) Transcript_68739:683-1453(+)
MVGLLGVVDVQPIVEHHQRVPRQQVRHVSAHQLVNATLDQSSQGRLMNRHLDIVCRGAGLRVGCQPCADVKIVGRSPGVPQSAELLNASIVPALLEGRPSRVGVRHQATQKRCGGRQRQKDRCEHQELVGEKSRLVEIAGQKSCLHAAIASPECLRVHVDVPGDWVPLSRLPPRQVERHLRNLIRGQALLAQDALARSERADLAALALAVVCSKGLVPRVGRCGLIGAQHGLRHHTIGRRLRGRGRATRHTKQWEG